MFSPKHGTVANIFTAAMQTKKDAVSECTEKKNGNEGLSVYSTKRRALLQQPKESVRTTLTEEKAAEKQLTVPVQHARGVGTATAVQTGPRWPRKDQAHYHARRALESVRETISLVKSVNRSSLDP